MARLILKLKNLIGSNTLFRPLYVLLHNLKKKRIEQSVFSQIAGAQNLSEKDLFDFQKNKLFNFLSYAKENCDYYKKIFKKDEIDITSIDGFKKIPFLTKSIITSNLSSLISKEFGLENLAKKNTGGSTGKPLEFYCTTEAGLMDYAYHFYQYKEFGYKEGDLILGAGALVIPEELRKKNIYWMKIGDREAFGDYKLSILYLNQNNVKFYVQKLLETKPSILRGYPSLYDSLAQYIIKNKISLNFTIKVVSLTSEMCSENQRMNIEKAFRTQVVFEYGHTEVSVLCHTKDQTYNYESYPTYCYVEVLNDDGTDTEVGNVGNIVVTGFLNKGMPFIRYRTEDLGTLSYRNGGFVHFSKINGRSQDFIITKDRSKISISALTSWQHLNAFANISKWQIVQNSVGIIEISIIKGPSYSEKDELEIRAKIQNVADIDLNFKYVDSIPRTKGGKHLFMVQNL